MCVILLKTNDPVQIEKKFFTCDTKICRYKYTLINSTDSVVKGQVVIILKSSRFQTRTSSGDDRGKIVKMFELAPMSRVVHEDEYPTHEKLNAYFRVYISK